MGCVLKATVLAFFLASAAQGEGEVESEYKEKLEVSRDNRGRLLESVFQGLPGRVLFQLQRLPQLPRRRFQGMPGQFQGMPGAGLFQGLPAGVSGLPPVQEGIQLSYGQYGNSAQQDSNELTRPARTRRPGHYNNHPDSSEEIVAITAPPPQAVYSQQVPVNLTQQPLSYNPLLQQLTPQQQLAQLQLQQLTPYQQQQLLQLQQFQLQQLTPQQQFQLQQLTPQQQLAFQLQQLTPQQQQQLELRLQQLTPQEQQQLGLQLQQLSPQQRQQLIQQLIQPQLFFPAQVPQVQGQNSLTVEVPVLPVVGALGLGALGLGALHLARRSTPLPPIAPQFGPEIINQFEQPLTQATPAPLPPPIAPQFDPEIVNQYRQPLTQATPAPPPPPISPQLGPQLTIEYQQPLTPQQATSAPAPAPQVIFLQANNSVPIGTLVTARPRPSQQHVNNQVNNILDNVSRVNVTGIVDQALGIRAPVPVRNLVNGILNTVFCSPINRLLGRCRG